MSFFSSVRYKKQLVAQGFSQNLILICKKTYSLVLDTKTLQYLIILVARQGLINKIEQTLLLIKAIKTCVV